MSHERRQPDLNDHDLLIRIDERVGEFGHQFRLHLRRHWVVGLAAVTACLMSMGTLISLLLTKR